MLNDAPSPCATRTCGSLRAKHSFCMGIMLRHCHGGHGHAAAASAVFRPGPISSMLTSIAAGAWDQASLAAAEGSWTAAAAALLIC